MAELPPIRDNYGELRSIFEEMLQAKNNAQDNNKQQVDLLENRKNAALLFVLIKKINRQVKYSVRSGREKLQDTKLQMDSKLMHLQNLLYESKHLKREVRNCYQFKSQDEDIDLLPENDSTTVQMKRPELTNGKATEHTVRLGRLECELNLRKQLSEQYKELLNSKRQFVQEMVLQVECLTSFAPSLHTLVKAARPLQDALKMPIEREWKLAQVVQLLPKPLYLAYMNIHALETSASLDDANVSVTVVGIEDDIFQTEISRQEDIVKNYTQNLRNVSTIGNNNNNHNKINKFQTETVPEVSDNSKHMEPHPLMVRFTIIDANNADTRLETTLRYFESIDFVTAHSIVISNENEPVLGEQTATNDILKNLFDGDIGDCMPSSRTIYKLQKLTISTDEYLKHLNEKSYGKPYRWLQNMCALEENSMRYNEDNEHIGDDDDDDDDVADVAYNKDFALHKIVPATMKRIHNLWKSRLNLIKQIRALITKNFDVYLKNEKYPTTKPSCSLVQWTTVDWEEYSANTNTKQYIAAKLIKPNNFFFRAVIVRGSAKMECLVSVSSKFPNDSPLWVICIYWNGEHSATNNAAIKMMEYWTNCLLQSELNNASAMLSAQLVRTMYSFDVFLETEGPFYSPVEYSTEKHFLRSFSKRIKARPYRYIEGTINSFRQ